MTNPLSGWRLDPRDVGFRGEGLVRPECILADRRDYLWAADGRGGIMELRPDGAQRLIAPPGGAAVSQSGAPPSLLGSAKCVPNGFAIDGDRFVFADIMGGTIVEMAHDGSIRTILRDIDGVALGSVNFVLTDSRGRRWVTVSSRMVPADKALNPRRADGYIILIDDRGARIVADGFAFTNEIRLDAREEWLYVVETAAKRISRLRVHADGSLRDREVHGPASLGAGFPDGFAFDADGNLWCAMILSERLIAVTPDGEVLTLFDDGNPAALAAAEAAFLAGEVSPAVSLACRGPIGGLLTSVTFGGPDLRTVYLGSLLGDRIPCFRSPVAGLPMVHW